LTLGQAGRCGRPVLSLRAAARSKAVRRVAEPVRLQLAAARDADRAVVLLRVASGEVDGLTALRLNGANGAGAPLALRLPNRPADIQVQAADEQKRRPPIQFGSAAFADAQLGRAGTHRQPLSLNAIAGAPVPDAGLRPRWCRHRSLGPHSALAELDQTRLESNRSLRRWPV
jgi:hypothetical protein